MTTLEQKSEDFFVRHSWKVLLAVSIIFGLFGIGDIFLGMNADPAIAESLTGVEWEALQASSPEIAHLIDMQVRSGGIHLLVLSILTIVVCLVGFRRGQGWAWYTLWALPLWTALVFVVTLTAERQPDFPPPPPMLSAPIFFVVTVLALVITYRKFFPKEQPDSRAA
jgi:hypothetical protein